MRSTRPHPELDNAASLAALSTHHLPDANGQRSYINADCGASTAPTSGAKKMIELCMFAALLSFEVHALKPLEEYSHTYQKKWLKRDVGLRAAECLTITRLVETKADAIEAAIGYHPDLLWVLATAMVESGLDPSEISNRKAKSSMQTYAKYCPMVACRKKSRSKSRSKPKCDCDLRFAGVVHATKLSNIYGWCNGAARYNAGPRGSCDKPKPLGKFYAHRVMDTYDRLFQYWEVDIFPDHDDDSGYE